MLNRSRGSISVRPLRRMAVSVCAAMPFMAGARKLCRVRKLAPGQRAGARSFLANAREVLREVLKKEGGERTRRVGTRTRACGVAASEPLARARCLSGARQRRYVKPALFSARRQPVEREASARKRSARARKYVTQTRRAGSSIYVLNGVPSARVAHGAPNCPRRAALFCR